jgi:hypothetical protein
MGGKEEIATWGLGPSTSVGETTAQAFKTPAGRGDRNLVRHPSVMFARDQFLNRVGITGVRNRPFILKVHHAGRNPSPLSQGHAVISRLPKLMQEQAFGSSLDST